MSDQISVYFQKLADAFLSGDFQYVGSRFTYPLAIYLEGDIHVEFDREDSLVRMIERREVALLNGIRKIDTQVMDVGPMEQSRFPVRVDWLFLSESGLLVAKNEVRYFCRREARLDFIIEIVEFASLGLRGAPHMPDPKTPLQ